MADSGNVTDDEHSSGSESSKDSEFEGFREDEIREEGNITGYYKAENPDYDRELPTDLEISWRHNAIPSTIFLHVPELV